jgi:hypothetical protein
MDLVRAGGWFCLRVGLHCPGNAGTGSAGPPRSGKCCGICGREIAASNISPHPFRSCYYLSLATHKMSTLTEADTCRRYAPCPNSTTRVGPTGKSANRRRSRMAASCSRETRSGAVPRSGRTIFSGTASLAVRANALSSPHVFPHRPVPNRFGFYFAQTGHSHFAATLN